PLAIKQKNRRQDRRRYQSDGKEREADRQSAGGLLTCPAPTEWRKIRNARPPPQRADAGPRNTLSAGGRRRPAHSLAAALLGPGARRGPDRFPPTGRRPSGETNAGRLGAP